MAKPISERIANTDLTWANHHGNPLDGTRQSTSDPNYNFMYFVKIVPTSYLPIGWEKHYRAASQLLDDSSRAMAAALSPVPTIAIRAASMRRSRS